MPCHASFTIYYLLVVGASRSFRKRLVRALGLNICRSLSLSLSISLGSSLSLNLTLEEHCLEVGAV